VVFGEIAMLLNGEKPKPLLNGEELKPLVQLADELVNKPHPTTMIRWAKKGFRGEFLESVCIGREWFSSTEALARFLAKIQPSRPQAEAALAATEPAAVMA
jgi:Protein of unknown function (DUF1580)